MTRTITAADKPPYPTIGECLRFVVNAFDLRGHGDSAARKRLDRLANEGDYDWTLFPELLDQMITVPLAKCTDEEFAHFVAARLFYIRDSYIALLGTISLDALTHDEALPALTEHFFVPTVSRFIHEAKATFGGPDPILLLAPSMATANGKADNFNPIEAVLQWFIRAHTGTFGDVRSRLYDRGNDSGGNKRDLLYRQLRGKQTPDAAALLDLVKTVQARTWYRHSGPTPQLLARWLFIARALIWAESSVASEEHLRPGLMRWASKSTPAQIDAGGPLAAIVARKGSRWTELASVGARAFFSISTRQNLNSEQLAGAINDVREFRRVVQTMGMPPFALYMLHWCEARQAVWEGNRSDALRLYTLAADAALYRSGPEMKKLLLEAVLMAAECRKKAIYNQLMSRAAALHVFTHPLGRPIDKIPHMDGINVNFQIYFPYAPSPGQRIT